MRPIISKVKDSIPNTSVVAAQEPIFSFTLLLIIFCELTNKPTISANASPTIITSTPQFNDSILIHS